MSELKITIDQLKNYLFTNLKISFHEDGELYDFVGLEEHYQGVMLHHKFDGCVRSELKYIKPICYRLSDLDKFIPELGFVPLEQLKSVDGEYYLDFEDDVLWVKDQCKLDLFEITRVNELLQKLFQWHFWPFGDEYFEQGLVIDKLLNYFPPH